MALTSIVAFCLLLAGSVHGKAVRAGCQISTNTDIAEYGPLILIPGGPKDQDGFFQPDAAGTISFNANQEVLLACPGSNNSLTASGSSQATAICQSGTTFTIDGTPYEFSQLTCKSDPFNTARTVGTCATGFSLVHIGFEVGEDFYSIIEVCFDDALSRTLYSKFYMKPSIAGAQHNVPRPSFIEGGYYPDYSANEMYVRTVQRETISTILGSAELGSKYIQDGNDFFLSRGHLTAKADFVYGSQQRVTFYFINVAPQWQTANGANWNALEDSVRRFAASRELELTIYTGTYGIATLPDVNGVDQELYLYIDPNNNYRLPVPKLYWKAVYDPSSKKGVVFVEVNNPYVDVTPDYIVCNDVSESINYVSWDRPDITKGYSYTCEVNEFRKTVTDLPEFEVVDLLT